MLDILSSSVGPPGIPTTLLSPHPDPHSSFLLARLHFYFSSPRSWPPARPLQISSQSGFSPSAVGYHLHSRPVTFDLFFLAPAPVREKKKMWGWGCISPLRRRDLRRKVYSFCEEVYVINYSLVVMRVESKHLKTSAQSVKYLCLCGS